MGRSVRSAGRPTGTGGRGRKKLARERGVVPSSIPAQERLVKCGGCQTEVKRGETRFGYCTGCWKEPTA